ncbi:unnamed protein product [Clonostachys rhizophaga]|uniref:C2H2-type domain-containing protein n=1 Tax=Clonostachys rhizophaga TaxID=160324 RepID=A0A9N9YSP2_9HYPO|nr:unnamed protein product [Clonostachys rhizophaga]
MAQERNDTQRRAPFEPSDFVEGDIMAFSDLDLRRLGLATENIHGPNTHHDREQSRLLSSQPSPIDPQLVGFSSSGVNDDEILRSLGSAYPEIPSASSSTSFPGPVLQGVPERGHMNMQTPNTSLESPPFLMPSYQDHLPPALETQHQGLPRRRSRYFRNGAYQSGVSTAIDIPNARSSTSGTSDPLQRWRDSPPEMEAASLSDIANALKDMPLKSRSSAGSLRSQKQGSHPGSIVSHGSATSRSTGGSNSSAGSALLRSSDRVRSRVSKRTGGPRIAASQGKKTDKRNFHCTFCCDSFKSKYDWSRHEKSLHLNLDSWKCFPSLGTTVSPVTREVKCSYCGVPNPTDAHLDSNHYHGSCHVDREPPRFIRKDHLVQHLRHVHQVKNPDNIESCKEEGPKVASRCGFCNIRMETWEARVEHLARHFKSGATMDQWKGEHDFDPSIAAQVRHAIAPYLIGSESRAPLPFSATSHKDHLSQIRGASEYCLDKWRQIEVSSQESPECATAPPEPENLMQNHTDSMMFPDILAVHLARFARKQIRLGIMPTDRMFQNEARQVVFDSVDPWDQTIADNDVWLDAFRNQHLGGSPDGRGEE